MEGNKGIKRKQMILEGNLYKVILTLSLPLMFNNFIQTVYNVTDSYFVSRLGSKELAAVTLVWPVAFLLISLAMGVDTAGSAMISQQYGAGNKEKARELSGQLLSFSLMYSIIIGLISYVFCENIIRFMGGEGELLSLSVDYLKVISLGTPFMSYVIAYTYIRQGMGDTVSPMKLNIVSVGLNLILDPIFIFALGLGVKGAAIATTLARIIATVIIIYIIHIKKGDERIGSDHMVPKWIHLKEILKRGIPLSIGTSATAMGFIILNMFVVRYGEEAMAAFGVGNRIVSLIIMPIMGIGGAVSIVVGQNLGSGKKERILEAFKKTMVIIAVLSIPSTILVWRYSSVLVGIFAKAGEVNRMGSEYLRWISVTIFSLGLFRVVVGVFQGISHSKKAMFLDMSRLWLMRLPMIVGAGMVFSLGELNIWYSMCASNILSSIIALYMLMRTDIEKVSMVEISKESTP